MDAPKTDRELKRLLIVDDHAGIRELFSFHMHRENFMVDEAEDGLQGLIRAARNPPDLIVLDLMMPKLDGRGVLIRLREQGLGHIPVIVVTGYSEAFNKAAILKEPNVVDYLTKPMSFAGLGARIRVYIAKGIPAPAGG